MKNQAFCDLMTAAGFNGRQLAAYLSNAGAGSGPTNERTISRWRMGDHAPRGSVVRLLQLLAERDA